MKTFPHVSDVYVFCYVVLYHKLHMAMKKTQMTGKLLFSKPEDMNKI